jgi:hypothetical protein
MRCVQRVKLRLNIDRHTDQCIRRVCESGMNLIPSNLKLRLPVIARSYLTMDQAARVANESGSDALM